ncbi:MAG: hypothetical protein QM809_10055 [Gordonia sp. (in: high G+C Gram-positive bacteria)]|uniref:hypothetical protein n=1 Tax=Gordonia sp. (in: high G+C Gram-positive bacteria) TaxID=84139 RepID=UPI0039E37B33
MKKIMTRAASMAASAGIVAAGLTTMAAGTAEAAPGDLRVTVDAKCVVSHDRPATDRIIYVTNVGGATVRNIRIAEVDGPQHGIPRLRPDQETRPSTVGGMRYYSHTGVRTANALRPGEMVKTWHVVPGCNGPWSIAGYATGNPGDNLINNGDVRWDSKKPRNERPSR